MQVLYMADAEEQDLDGCTVATQRLAERVLLPTVHQEPGNNPTPVL
jgi:hypothetical protein